MEHYEVLGVAADAGESEIKRAWARLVRQHPPDQDPEGNRRLNEAKAILLDPRARADYDARRQYGAEIDSLFEEGFEAKEAEDWTRAIQVFKEILALHPSSLDARNQLGICLCQAGRYSESHTQYERLIKEAPNSALYMANIAYTCEEWADSLTDGSPGQRSRYSEAESWLKKAIEAESFNASHHRHLSRIYRSQGLFGEAEKALEAAIGADGRADFDDVDTMMDLAWLMLIQGKPERMGGVADRVLSVLPPDPEARDYASRLFLRNAAQLVEDDYLEPAAHFVRAARRITSHFGENEEWAQDIERFAEARVQAKRMIDDESVRPRAFALLAGALVERRTGMSVDDDVIDSLVEAVGTWSPQENAAAARAIRNRYPAVAKLASDLLDRALEIERPVPAPSPVATNSGGCVIPLLVFAFLILSACYFL